MSGSQPSGAPGTARPRASQAERYQWVALTNTTMAVFMSSLDGMIILIALPAIFNGIHLDPLAPANIAYLLWMIMGYRLVQAVFVVNLGRLGDILGRVRIYNLGFVVFAVASILLSLDPFTSTHAALWLIGWRFLQAFGGSMLAANSAAILTDAFPRERRGFALGVNQTAILAGQFIGLTAGGLLAAWDWRAVFWVNVPVGIAGTLWAYFRLRDNGLRQPARIDWWGNATFAIGLSAILVAVTYGIQSYDGRTMGWSNPAVIAGLAGGAALLAVFVAIERRVAEPLFQLRLFKIRAFTAGNLTGFTARLAYGGLQFVLIIWLQGVWLPLHGYNYSQTPLWAGIFVLPMTAGFFIAGPLSGTLSDRFGARWFASGGMFLFALSFVGLLLLPVNFPYLAFALLIALNGVGLGMYSSPNSSSIMSSVPAEYRGVASGMRSTFQNSGTSLSIGVFFSLMIAGLASALPRTLTSGLAQHGVSHQVAAQIGRLPPVSSLFAAMLDVNPVHYLLSQHGALSPLTPADRDLLTGREFFPNLISGPFHDGLVLVFAVSAALGLIAAIASLMRGTTKLAAETEIVPPPAARLSTSDTQVAQVAAFTDRRSLHHAREPPWRRAAQPARRPPHPRLGPPRPAGAGELHPDQPRLRARDPHPGETPWQAARPEHLPRPQLDAAAGWHRRARSHRARPGCPDREAGHPRAHPGHRPRARRHPRERPRQPQPHPGDPARQGRARPTRLGRAHAGAVTRPPRLRLPALRPRPGPRAAGRLHPRRRHRRHQGPRHRPGPARRHLRDPLAPRTTRDQSGAGGTAVTP
jgi:MFS family permease